MQFLKFIDIRTKRLIFWFLLLLATVIWIMTYNWTLDSRSVGYLRRLGLNSSYLSQYGGAGVEIQNSSVHGEKLSASGLLDSTVEDLTSSESYEKLSSNGPLDNQVEDKQSSARNENLPPNGLLDNAVENHKSSVQCEKWSKNGLPKNLNCEERFNVLQKCPPKGKHGRTPLANFYISVENQTIEKGSDFDTFAREYRKANVAYVHLPKAGGTSVEKVLVKTPGLTYKSKRDGTQLDHCSFFYEAARRDYQRSGRSFYYSKRTYGMHNYAFADRPFLYVTWFRHPVERIVSTFYYLKKHKCFARHALCKQSLLHEKSLTSYLKNSKNTRYPDIDNYTIRLLLFDEFPIVANRYEDCCGAYSGNPDDIPVIEEKHYLKAKENLESKMAFVGILEDWNTSQDMLTRMLDIKGINEEVHVNANSHRKLLTSFELEEIERRNKWDMKLYEDALRIYNRQKEVFLKMQGK